LVRGAFLIPDKPTPLEDLTLIMEINVLEDRSFGNFKGRVFPVLGLKDKVQLRTNFGTDLSKPFKWIPQSDRGSERRGVAEENPLDEE
jgi:hypothetical protein